MTPHAEHDSLTLELLDTHWFRLHWELTSQTMERAKCSLGGDWTEIKPVLRLFVVESEPTGSRQEDQVLQVVISDRFREWYLIVPEPERRYRAKLGLLTKAGRFYQLASSESVDTPREAGVREDRDPIDSILSRSFEIGSCF
ncbi:MAG: DUF4912 domain-containing protein [Planctomycetaceae bacterium]